MKELLKLLDILDAQVCVSFQIMDDLTLNSKCDTLGLGENIYLVCSLNLSKERERAKCLSIQQRAHGTKSDFWFQIPINRLFICIIEYMQMLKHGNGMEWLDMMYWIYVNITYLMLSENINQIQTTTHTLTHSENDGSGGSSSSTSSRNNNFSIHLLSPCCVRVQQTSCCFLSYLCSGWYSTNCKSSEAKI